MSRQRSQTDRSLDPGWGDQTRPNNSRHFKPFRETLYVAIFSVRHAGTC